MHVITAILNKDPMRNLFPWCALRLSSLSPVRRRYLRTPMASKRGVLALLLVALSGTPLTSLATEPPPLKVGALRLASAGPLFIAQHENFFRDEGIVSRSDTSTRRSRSRSRSLPGMSIWA